MNPQQLERIVAVSSAKQASIVTQLIRTVLGIWLPLRWANQPDLVNAAAAKSAVEVDLALAESRRWARAAIIEQLRALDALPASLPDPEYLYPRSGTPIVEVYKRPVRQAEHALRKGATLEQAEQVLTERATRIITADVAAVQRDEKDIVRAAAPAKVIGYRRILRPEKTKYGPCGLCIVAADRFYTREDLLELHNGCVCETAEVTSDFDPGISLNRADLDAIYGAAGGNFAEALQRTRVVVRENGELGPILVRDGDEFKERADATRQSKREQKFTPYSKPTRLADATNWGAMRETSERSIAILEDARLNGTNLVSMVPGTPPTAVRDIDQAIAYHRGLITRARAHGA